MSIWIVFLGLTFIAFVAGIFYLTKQVAKFNFINKLSKGNPKIAGLWALLCIFIATGAVYFVWGFINAMIVLLHFVMFYLLTGAIAYLVKKIYHAPSKETTNRPYYVGIIAVASTIVYLSVCYFLAHNVWITQYTVYTDKDIQPLRIALIADSHVGTLEDGRGFAKKISAINDYNPDIVVLAGDFVDDGSGYDDMTAAAKALGELNSKYGVYYVYGNHDYGYNDSESVPSRGYNGAQLGTYLKECGVNVMTDDTLCPCEGYAIVGRLDKSFENKEGYGRAPIASLLKDIDKSTYSIVIDHQPSDYENEAAAEADLVLSGHTHGGQMIPITWVGVWLGMNDSIYGLKTIGNTDFITTSGISDWEIQFKSGCKSEIVIIDIM